MRFSNHIDYDLNLCFFNLIFYKSLFSLFSQILNYVYDFYSAERVENDHLLRNSTICVEHNVATESKEKQLNIMTICNTGALATCSLGTALGRFD